MHITQTALAWQIAAMVQSRRTGLPPEDTARVLDIPSEGIIASCHLWQGGLYALQLTRSRLLYILAEGRAVAQDHASEYIAQQGITHNNHVPNPHTGTLVPKYPRLSRVTLSGEYAQVATPADLMPQGDNQ